MKTMDQYLGTLGLLMGLSRLRASKPVSQKPKKKEPYFPHFKKVDDDNILVPFMRMALPGKLIDYGKGRKYRVVGKVVDNNGKRYTQLTSIL